MSLTSTKPQNCTNPDTLTFCQKREGVLIQKILPTLAALGWDPKRINMQAWWDAVTGQDPFLQKAGHARYSFQDVVKTRNPSLDRCIELISFKDEIPLEFRQFVLSHPSTAILSAAAHEVAQGRAGGVSGFDVGRCWIRLPLPVWETICDDWAKKV